MSVTDIIAVVASIAAALFAFLTWLNQTRANIVIGCDLMLLDNNPRYFGFDNMKKPNIWISNIGYKSITVVNIYLRVGKDEFSLKNQLTRDEIINILVNPGEIKYIPIDTNMIINYISDLKGFYKRKIEDSTPICWKVETSDGRTFKKQSKNKVSDVVQCKGGRF